MIYLFLIQPLVLSQTTHTEAVAEPQKVLICATFSAESVELRPVSNSEEFGVMSWQLQGQMRRAVMLPLLHWKNFLMTEAECQP